MAMSLLGTIETCRSALTSPFPGEDRKLFDNDSRHWEWYAWTMIDGETT
jgi:hypothetical protein